MYLLTIKRFSVRSTCCRFSSVSDHSLASQCEKIPTEEPIRMRQSLVVQNDWLSQKRLRRLNRVASPKDTDVNSISNRNESTTKELIRFSARHFGEHQKARHEEDEFRRNLLEKFKRGESFQLDMQRKSVRLCLLYLISLVMESPEEEQMSFVQNGLQDYYHKVMEFLEYRNDVDTWMLTEFFNRLVLLNGMTNGAVLEKLGIKNFAQFAELILKHCYNLRKEKGSRLSYTLFVNSIRRLWPLICSSKDSDVESLKTKIEQSLGYCFRQLVGSVVENQKRLYRDQFKTSVINISCYLSCDLGIQLADYLNPWKLAVVLFNFLQLYFESPLGVEISGRCRNLIDFFCSIQRLQFPDTVPRTSINQFNELWLAFWIEKWLKIFEGLEMNRRLDDQFLYHGLEVCLIYKKLEILQERINKKKFFKNLERLTRFIADEKRQRLKHCVKSSSYDLHDEFVHQIWCTLDASGPKVS